LTALRRLPRDVWERRLKAYRCAPLDGLGKLNTGEWWKPDWRGAWPFVVPVEDDGYIDQIALDRLIAGLIELAPWDTRFDHDPEA
jgi:hypothetical protein